MWFKPAVPKHLEDIGGRDAEFNAGGFAQLRFEGIDALELHYGPTYHQAEAPALAARDFLLSKADFDDVEFTDSGLTVRSSSPESINGHILTRGIDPYGRPVAFVYTGQPPAASGSEAWLDVPRLNRSINAKLMAEGHAYPAYYTERNGHGGLPWDLRERLTKLAQAAQGKGLWPADVSMQPTSIPGLPQLEKLAIWPKLFRRLVGYFKGTGGGLGGFDAWLRADPDERDDEVWIIPRGELGRFHNVVKVEGGKIRMLYRPEELVIVPR
jgi:endonuclease YncB( thermonuclease family)